MAARRDDDGILIKVDVSVLLTQNEIYGKFLDILGCTYLTEARAWANLTAERRT